MQRNAVCLAYLNGLTHEEVAGRARLAARHGEELGAAGSRELEGMYPAMRYDDRNCSTHSRANTCSARCTGERVRGSLASLAGSLAGAARGAGLGADARAARRRGAAPSNRRGHVGRRIEAAIGRRRARHRAESALWPALAAGLAAIAIIFGGLYSARAPDRSAQYVAVISDADSGPIWLLQAFEESGELRVSDAHRAPAAGRQRLRALDAARRRRGPGLPRPDSRAWASRGVTARRRAALEVLAQTIDARDQPRACRRLADGRRRRAP